MNSGPQNEQLNSSDLKNILSILKKGFAQYPPREWESKRQRFSKIFTLALSTQPQLLGSIPTYQSTRAKVLKNRINKAISDPPNQEHLNSIFIELYLIYLELTIRGIKAEQVERLKNFLGHTFWNECPEEFSRKSILFQEKLSNEIDEKKSAAEKTLNKLEEKSIEIEEKIRKSADLKYVGLLSASNQMIRTWKARLKHIKIVIKKQNFTVNAISMACIIWPFFILLNMSIECLNFIKITATLESMPYISISAAIQILLIYFYRIAKSDLNNLKNRESLMDQRTAASEIMVNYFDYLIDKKIDTGGTVEKINELLFCHIESHAKEKEISPYNLSVKLPDINQNFGKTQ